MRTGRPLLVDGLHLVALCGFAVAQPLFDRLGENPAFFHVRRGGAADVLLVAVLLAVAVPATLVALEGVAALLAERVRRGLHAVLVTALAAVVVLPILGRQVAAPPWVLFAVSGGAGLLVTAAYLRLPAVRGLCTALAAALPIFVAAFLFWSPVASIVLPPAITTAVAGGTARTPVVVLVFDEFSSTALMDTRMRIEARRFPNFAALATEATWFRNATTVASMTEAAVGAILTGRYPRAGKVDWAALASRNLFTLLAGSHDLQVIETYLPFCPPSLCPDAMPRAPLTDRLRPLLGDVAVTFLHVVAPPEIRRRLPGLSNPLLLLNPSASASDTPPAWDMRGLLVARRVEHGTVGLLHREEVFDQFLARITPSHRPTLHYLHALLPHDPSVYLPSGKMCPTPLYRDPWSWGPDPLPSAQAYYRYLQQVQYVDTLVGRLVARLKAAGLWEESLVVITGDHGTSFRPGHHRRALEPATQCDVMAVPLFVKTPGQRQGGASDHNAESVDILPTIADVLGVPIPWPVDGASVVNAELHERPAKTLTGPFWGQPEKPFFGSGTRLARWARLPPACLDLGTKRALVTTDEATGDLVLRIGPYGGLVGRTVASLGMIPPAEVAVNLSHGGSFHDVDPSSRVLPCTIAGSLSDPVDGTRLVNVAVALNGRIAAVTRTAPAWWRGPPIFFAPVPEGAFRPGDNEVEVFVVRGDAGAPNLTRAEVRGTEPWTLREGGGTPTIGAPDGSEIRVEPGAIEGTLEVTTFSNVYVSGGGWAVDPKHGKPAFAALVFLDGRFSHRAPIDLPRPDIEKRYGRPEVATSGFGFAIPVPRASSDPTPRMRVFAVTEDLHAGELAPPPGKQPATSRDGDA